MTGTGLAIVIAAGLGAAGCARSGAGPTAPAAGPAGAPPTSTVGSATTSAGRPPAARNGTKQGSRAPSRPPVIKPGPVFVVGDSLTVGAEPWLDGALRTLGWRLTGVDARIGRGVPEGLDVLRANQATLPPTVLIALGTNNLSSSAGDVTSWLADARAIAGPRRRIVWVDLCLDDRAAPRLAAFRAVNEALVDAAPRFGVEIADWCRFAAARGIEPVADGIHYGDSGYQARADFYGLALSGRATTPAPGSSSTS